MTRIEFAEIAAYIGIACGKALAPESQEVFFDLLEDIPFDAMKTAAKRVMLKHRYPTFPSLAELREAAVETMSGQVAGGMSPAEAWGLAWRAIGKIDPEVDGSAERGLKGLPECVVAAVRIFGINDLCYGKEPIGVIRGQFMKMFEQISSRAQRAAIMPATVREAITSTPSRIGSPVAKMLDGIGRGPT